jgi:hypothetical protein
LIARAVGDSQAATAQDAGFGRLSEANGALGIDSSHDAHIVLGRKTYVLVGHDAGGLDGDVLVCSQGHVSATHIAGHWWYERIGQYIRHWRAHCNLTEHGLQLNAMGIAVSL